MEYTINFFINKVENIPEHLFCTGELINKQGQSCINGHCGLNSTRYSTPESLALIKLFDHITVHDFAGNVIYDYVYYCNKAAYINNGTTLEYQQPSIKERVLAALYDIRAVMYFKDVDLDEITFRWATMKEQNMNKRNNKSIKQAEAIIGESIEEGVFV